MSNLSINEEVQEKIDHLKLGIDKVNSHLKNVQQRHKDFPIAHIHSILDLAHEELHMLLEKLEDKSVKSAMVDFETVRTEFELLKLKVQDL